MDREEAGKLAAIDARQETKNSIARHKKAGSDSVIAKLVELKSFEGEKPFCFQGNILYSKKLPDPQVQLGAAKYLAVLNDMEPDHKISLDVTGNLSDKDRDKRIEELLEKRRQKDEPTDTKG